MPHAAGGFREHCCFCFLVARKRSLPKRLVHSPDDLEENLEDKKNIQHPDKHKYVAQVESGNVLGLQGLTKVYNG